MNMRSKKLATESVDCSQILTHLIRQNKDISDADAKKILKEILGVESASSKPKILSSPVGYYLNKTPYVYTRSSGGYNPPKYVRAVCFTESTLQGLEAHNSIYGAKYGVSFPRETLFRKGANPVLNIREDLLNREVGCLVNADGWKKIKNHIPEDLVPFVNIINDKFDATHEREWRIAGDLEFEINDLFVIFCPESDFAEFKQVQTDGKPILFDMDWLKFV